MLCLTKNLGWKDPICLIIVVKNRYVYISIKYNVPPTSQDLRLEKCACLFVVFTAAAAVAVFFLFELLLMVVAVRFFSEFVVIFCCCWYNAFKINRFRMQRNYSYQHLYTSNI